ncbi:MAG: ATP-binding protein [Acidobacteriota bacterium]|nr:ATP-binding protein [Acidobacteriota bacterium]
MRTAPGDPSNAPSPVPSMLFFLLRGSPRAVLLRAGLMIAAIAFVDWRVEGNIPLGFLYLFPMLLAGSALKRWEIAAVAALCAILTENFDTFEWFPESGIPRDILIFAAFFGMGLFVYEAVRNRQAALEHLREIETEILARREAEEQLKVLVESSPAAIFTTNGEGSVLLANDAAHRLFALDPGTLAGQSVGEYLPALVNVTSDDHSRQEFRTVMQCRGRRRNGEVFLADVWFSTYATSAGSRLAAMVVDASEELRTREEFSLHQLLAGSRILVGAVSHEIRNVCGAIAVVHANLARSGALAYNTDFQALGTLIVALEKIASMDLRQTADQAASVDLNSLLEELRIVIEPSLREEGVDVFWDVESNLPAVWADRQSLMQVFLNLSKNAERAMLERSVRRLTVNARSESNRIVVQFRDTGGGVPAPDRLFQPFQQGAHATGLGLYLSRAFARSFRGDLRYEPEPGGSRFIVELSAAVPANGKETYGPGDPDSIGGRPQLVPGGAQPVARGRA